MKQLVYSLLLVFYSLSIFAQQTGILNDENGQPSIIFLKLPDTTYIHHIKDGQIPDYLTFDNKYEMSPNEMFNRGSFDNQTFFIDNLDSIEPGILPEGDLPYKIKYTADGQRLIVIYHNSNNVYIYDANTHETLGIVNVGLGPEDMVVTDQHIYVCCYYSHEIYIINLDSYSIESNFPVEPRPCVISVNSDESIIYIGFHVGEHRGGFLAAYELNSYNQLFSNSWPFIDQINMWEGKIGRLVYTYSKFLLVANDQYIACLNQVGKNLIFLDAITGDIVKDFGINSFAIVSTPSSDTLYTAGIRAGNSGMRYHCINTNTFDILDSIIAPTTVSPIAWYWQDNLCIDPTGKKLFVEVGTMEMATAGFLADFNNHEHTVFDLSNVYNSRYFPAVSYDGRYVILPGEDLSVFDFETEDYASTQWVGRQWAGCKIVTASQNSYKFVLHTHIADFQHLRWMRNEQIDFYDFTDPANIVHSDSIFCGQEPEADFSYCAILNSHHNKIITGNPLSGNISIIDAVTHELDTLINLKRIAIVKNITDDLVVLTGFDCNYLYLFDLNTLSIVKEFPNTSNKIDVVLLSPDQQYFYTYGRYEDELIKYHIDGINTAKVDSMTVEDTFVHQIDWDIWYYPEISPDGLYILFQYFGDLQIVNTERMDIDCVMSSAQNLFDMAFTDDSKRVCLAHGFGMEYFSIIYLDGINSYLEHTVNTEYYGGMAVEYNPVDQKFYLATANNILVVDPVSGLIEDTLFLDGLSEKPLFLGIDPAGNPVVNTFRYLYYNDEVYYLREPIRSFYVDNESHKCILASPGPDRVFVLDFLTSEIHEIPISKVDDGVTIYPNPTNDKITIKSGKLINKIEIFNSSGEKLFDKNYRNTMTTLSLSGNAEGVYFVKIHRGEDSVSKKIVVAN